MGHSHSNPRPCPCPCHKLGNRLKRVEQEAHTIRSHAASARMQLERIEAASVRMQLERTEHQGIMTDVKESLKAMDTRLLRIENQVRPPLRKKCQQRQLQHL
jgi:hypothetical protein